MVETRKMKAARLARGEVHCEDEVAQPQRSIIHRLPTEIRLMIYKEAWTPSFKPWDYHRKEQDKGKPVREQIKQLKVLLSVCRLFRDEILPEYFNKTQAHVIYAPGCPHDLGVLRYGRSEKVLAAQRIMKRSRLFLENVKHVRLHWLSKSTWWNWEMWVDMGDNHGRENILAAFDLSYQRPWQQVGTLEWLASLKSLQTLEIVFIDTRRRDIQEPAVYFGKDSLAWQELLKLPKLERISFLVYTKRCDEWKGEGRSMGRKEILEQALLKDPAAKKEQMPHRFDFSIGAVRDVESLPKLFEIS